MLIPHIEGDDLLIKHCKGINQHLSLKPKTVIFAGNGCVAGGNDPLCESLKEQFKIDVEPSIAASMCSIVAQRFKGKKLFALKDLVEIIENAGSIDSYMSDYYDFKNSLCQKFNDSFDNKKISLRDSDIISQIIGGTNKEELGVVTTNWDKTFWASSNFLNVVQLHGLSDQRESIVLPSEFATDEDLMEILDNYGNALGNEVVRLQVLRMFRDQYRRPLQVALHTAEFWMNSAQTIVIWGLALHPYDSEVRSLLNAVGKYASKDIKKRIIVVNPDKNVATLGRALLNKVTGKFEYYSG